MNDQDIRWHSRDLPDVADTESLGRELASGLAAGDVVILDGPLGAGKTALARGIGAGLGVVGRVSSPTFIIAREHRPGGPGRPGMVHVDAYRLGGLDELDALDLDTDLTDDVVVVEWGEGVAEVLADRHLSVRLRRDPDSDVRHAQWGWVYHD
ncbi:MULTISPECIES: tRNA (adenosine(37)-N6)-threonylcarbamoyltransferase complex ATPase subunit type 1 TsaE [Gordonia]|uniref:tRNA (adenosine(37)-N6)-threonylcarbamoyltransferase complex ATPase subunit type 1 TsaE n=1 Tax=Gordonia TaxID=2053 RepID=UPI001FEAF016|nr:MULTISPECIES: tRNA (adenosine(37)-N6)-threonylcarbamoyltransferase complex ATPase subunit type 1 TsaE [Gordonia]